MMHRYRLAAVTAIFTALAVFTPGVAVADGSLVATVGPGFTISLTSAGKPVTSLTPGTYTITVHDQSSFHDFHLQGPGVDQATDVEGTGDQTWTVTLAEGTYTFQCDAHPTQMHGSIKVGAQTTTSAPAPVKLHATLSARAEVPKQAFHAPNGKGSFTATLKRNANGTGVLAWKLTFSGLSGRALAAHVHLAPAGKAGNVIVPLCSPCTSGAHGSAKLTAAIVKDLLKPGATYVNVHTRKNPNGEIRGQLARG